MDKDENWKPVPHSVARNKSLSAQAFRVWAVIRSHEDCAGKTELSNATICKESNLNLRTVQRAKKELHSLHLLSTLRKPGKQGDGASIYSTRGGCQKRTSKETLYPTSISRPSTGSIPSPSWERSMLIKHDCHGCGWCHQCRAYESSLTTP